MSESNYITATKEAMNNAYVPYSNYPVGALIVTTNGNTYSGCNVENASFLLETVQKLLQLPLWCWLVKRTSK